MPTSTTDTGSMTHPGSALTIPCLRSLTPSGVLKRRGAPAILAEGHSGRRLSTGMSLRMVWWIALWMLLVACWADYSQSGRTALPPQVRSQCKRGEEMECTDYTICMDGLPDSNSMD